MIVLSMGDGIATGHHILNMLDVKHDYLAVEKSFRKQDLCDKNACISRPVNDIYELLEWLKVHSFTARNIDLVLCGFTCKSLSSAGKRELWDGESKVFFECVKVLDFIKSLNPGVKFLFENVASMPDECRDLITNMLGVEHFELDAGLIGPQARVRYYWFNWDKKEVIPAKNMDAKNFLDDDGLDLVSFSKSNRGRDENGRPIVKGRFRKDGKAGTLLCGHSGKGQSTWNFVITKKMKTRDITLDEGMRFQGIDFLDFSGFSEVSAWEAIGDGWDFRAVKMIITWLFW